MRLIICIFLLSLIACGGDEQPDLPGKTVVILFDLSASTDTAARADYIAETAHIMDAMQPGDVLIAHAITDKSIREKTEICNIRFPVNTNTSTNQFARQNAEEQLVKNMESAKMQATGKIKAAVNNTDLHYPYTDIFSALILAQQYIANNPAQQKRIVIMSDMIESDKEYEFAKEQLNENKTHEIIEALKKNNAFPSLENVEVYICGADASSNERYFQIRDFWKIYFTNAGCVFNENNYGTSLQSFNE